MSEARLQKILARAGCGSRRVCEGYIEAGRVCVNGAVAKLGDVADVDADEILFDGKPIGLPESVVIALNKPCGYTSSMADPHADHCVSELIPLERYPSLFHVGRLDVDTSGLLLFTTDGDLGQALMHPSHEVTKTYVAHVEGNLGDEDLGALRAGVMLEDGLTAPAEVHLVRPSCRSWVQLRIHEGRNRQVRRMMEAVGHPVISLERTAIGSFGISGLDCGAWKMLDEAEVKSLFA